MCFLGCVDDNFWVLLVYDKLVASCCGYFASLIAFEVDIDHDVWSVYNNLNSFFCLGVSSKEELFIDVYFCLDLIVFDFVVDDIVAYICAFEVEFEVAGITDLSCFDVYTATFVKGAGEGVGEVVLGSVGDDGDFFVFSDYFVLDLRADGKMNFFSLVATEVDFLDNGDFCCCYVVSFELDEDCFVLNFLDLKTEGYYFEGLMKGFAHYKADVDELLAIEVKRGEVKGRDEGGIGGVIVFSGDQDGEGDVIGISGCEYSCIDLYVFAENSVIVVAADGFVTVGLNEIYDCYSFFEHSCMCFDIDSKLFIFIAFISFHVEVLLIIFECGFESEYD